jgi:hypothetical protein
MSTQDNSRPKKVAAAPLIREPAYQVGRPGVSLFVVLPAALMSAIINGGLIFALMFFGSKTSSAKEKTEGPPTALEETKKETETVVQEDPPAPDPEPEESRDPLLIDEVDPAAQEQDIKINYKSDRDKEEFSVPGVVNRDEPLGVQGGDKSALPTNIPAPAGFGVGQGGGLASDVPGAAPSVGMAGGIGGLRGMPLAGTFYGRSGGTREKALREGGGTKETEAAVVRGLKWIARQQITSGPRTGCWPLDSTRFKDRGQSNDIAGTAFGLLPLLGAGFTHKKSRVASKENPYDKPIEMGLAFLIRKQDRKTGNFGGGMYAHALATIAMCEAYGLSQDPWLRRPAQMAVDYLIRAQHTAGGWRYSPNEPGDTSVTGWVVMALKSAQMANLAVPESTMRKAVAYIQSCCNTTTEGYGYTGPGSGGTMSAVGLLCRQYLQNWGSQNIRMIKGVENNLEKMPPGASKNMYYYYYATQVMHHFGGESWVKWNEKMRKVLVDTQITGGGGGSDAVGSWSSVGDAHGPPGGRLMITSLSILTLEVYYRHLPLYYRDTGEKRAQAN